MLVMQVHMDVKTPNVLLGRNNCAKLADVGLAKFLHKDYLSAAKSVVRASLHVVQLHAVAVAHSLCRKSPDLSLPSPLACGGVRACCQSPVAEALLILQGTFAWSAPEVLMGGRCSEKVDIFSLGAMP